MQGARYVVMVLIVCSLGLTTMAGKKNVETKNGEITGTGNLSKFHREELVAKIGKIKEFLQQSPDTNAVQLLSFAADLEKEVRNKKFGLVFEEHKERVDVELEENLPVLTENKSRLIDNGGEVNFLIEGDNLAALKLLEKTHRGKIDVIYIDPPYNTGNKDFVYNDSFVDVNDGYRHSKWLSFMKKRLELAKGLLREDGVIFISIDDHEQANLRLLCDEIFGENNFVDTLHWKRKKQPSFLARHTAKVMEYVVVYAKSACKLKKLSVETLSDATKKVVNLTNQSAIRHFKSGVRVKIGDAGVIRKGVYTIKSMTVEYLSDVHYRNGRTTNEVDVRALFSVSQDKIDSYIQDDLLFITVNNGLRRDVSSEERLKGKAITDLLLDWGDNQDSEKELKEIFDGKAFDYAKPTKLICNLVKSKQSDDLIILDFFAGSGTTGHAVMKLNAEDGGKRKFILVTNNENEICEKVTYERLKRVIEKENYAAKLKYYKIDYVPIKEQEYYEYADDLLEHVRELVELENGVDFTHDSEIAIVLTDEEIEKLSKNASKLKKIKTLYRGHNVLMSNAVEEKLKSQNIEIKVIPQYYYPELEG